MIFVISISIFLLIPKLFDYEKKQEIIKKHLINNYDLEINRYDSINFHISPFPNLSIKDADLKVRDEAITLKSKDIKIYLNLNNIYNYENLKSKKVVLVETEVDLEVDQLKDLLNYFSKLKSKLDIKNLKLNINKEERSLFKIKKIDFSNYGYKKFKINGEIFEKKFKAHFTNNNKDLYFKVLNTGIKADFQLKEKNIINSISGSSKVRFLKNYFKFDFNLSESYIEITKFNFKNKNISIFSESTINFKPFFDTKSNIIIKEINESVINNIRLEKLFKNKEIIKKLNSNNTINYKSKKFQNNFIKSYYSKSSLAYGRLIFSNEVIISGGNISCKGDSLLTDEYPRLNFICSFNLKDKKKFFKKFSIRKDMGVDPVNFNIEGSLNFFNKKINFKKINIGKSYIADKTDIKFFKETFESILFDESFFRIFKIDKFKRFLLAVI